MESTSKTILIVGGGIAGLTAALALAAEGFSVALFEAAEEFGEVGAGLQLSPNATNILRRLNVLPHLLPHAVQPKDLVLRDAATLRRLTEVPLGPAGAVRWGAPYLVAHRAAVQQALLTAVSAEPRITVSKGTQVLDVVFGPDDVRLSYVRDGKTESTAGALLIGADGVWSSLRRFSHGGKLADSVFSGMTAWRTTIDRASAELRGLPGTIPFDRVSSFLDPRAHLVAYPISAGEALNLVAITRGGSAKRGWAQTDGRSTLTAFLSRLPSPLRALDDLPAWTRWPLYAAPPELRWTGHRFALIGDAAHAMLPFAAQGAAMAIEGAAVLATYLAQHCNDPTPALVRFEAERRPRVKQVLARGRLNQLAWHAAGPIAVARDLVFKLKGPQSLAADLDWLYGWKEPRASL